MNGQVNARREAVVRLVVRGPAQTGRNVTAVVDTGYNGSLTLRPEFIRRLGLPLLGRSEARLADGSLVSFSVFAAEVTLCGRRIAVEIDESPSDSLMGMQLLEGHELNMRVRRGGAVTIRRLR